MRYYFFIFIVLLALACKNENVSRGKTDFADLTQKDSEVNSSGSPDSALYITKNQGTPPPDSKFRRTPITLDGYISPNTPDIEKVKKNLEPIESKDSEVSKSIDHKHTGQDKPTKSVKSTANSKKVKIKKKPKRKKKGRLKFASTTYNFGVLTEGDEIDKTFYFQNVGSAPVAISYIDVSCGCTTPNYSFMDIMPGAHSKISVHYNSKNKWGRQKPYLTIYTNGDPAEYILTMKGDVHEFIESPPVKSESSIKKDSLE